ncbi:flavin-containing monooxygenase [Aspergillus lucknowensis]|uniref:FAD/NAD(P)-binding domain-containing protein n=1 Tax=Aspergillus lucknowensis TaxID=176173 RepID=A0ABR4LRW2_9EURO
MAQQNASYDIVIVGAGFSGIYLLHSLRKLGYTCRVYESGTDLGGVWHWNTYPGARVDSEASIYQFSIPEVWKSWSFSEKFPAAAEIREYFAHLDKVLDIKKDVEFSTTVTGAQFDREGTKRWSVELADGRVTSCRFFLLCAGFTTKRYTPNIPGLETFKGDIYHSANWPRKGVDVCGKKVAVLGTGATGVQIIQDWGKEEVESLTVFQRTPNLALPMQQKSYSREAQEALKAEAESIFQRRGRTFAGYLDDAHPKNTFDVSAEERDAYYESLYKAGGFSFLLGGYSDILIDEKANREAYNFWAKKTRARITDPQKRDVLAPLEPPHPIGVKRCSLEVDYFEQFNRPNVHLVNVREPGNNIAAIRPDGIETANGTLYRVDAIALATGFDNFTGSLTQIQGLRNTDGTTLAEEWDRNGAVLYLGMTRRGYPNMFLAYSLHGPTALSNGPTGIEFQGQWIADAIRKIDESGLGYVEPTEGAEVAWKAQVDMIANMTLFPQADSPYMGSNIPGKRKEMLNWPGGIPMYEELCRKALESWDGFTVV